MTEAPEIIGGPLDGGHRPLAAKHWRQSFLYHHKECDLFHFYHYDGRAWIYDGAQTHNGAINENTEES